MATPVDQAQKLVKRRLSVIVEAGLSQESLAKALQDNLHVNEATLPVFLSQHAAAVAPSMPSAAAAEAHPLFVPDLALQPLSGGIHNSEYFPLNHELPWVRSIYRPLKKYLLFRFPKSLAIKKDDVIHGLLKLAIRLHNEGFSQLKILSPDPELDALCVFSAIKNTKKYKIKICPHNRFKDFQTCLISADCRRGEACALRYLSDVPEVVKAICSFAVRLDGLEDPLLYVEIGEFVEGEMFLERFMQLDFPGDFLQAIDWIEQLLTIVQKMHDRGCAHRDLKGENLIIAKGGRLVLIDQNFMIRCVKKSGIATSPRGTVSYCSLDKLKLLTQAANHYDVFFEDRYAAGIIIYELLSKKMFGVNQHTNESYTFLEMHEYLETTWATQKRQVCESAFLRNKVPVSFVDPFVRLVVGLTESDAAKSISLQQGIEMVQKLRTEAAEFLLREMSQSTAVRSAPSSASVTVDPDLRVIVTAASPPAEDPSAM